MSSRGDDCRVGVKNSPAVSIGILHPGEMGAAVGAALVDNGHEVLWDPRGRSDQTRRRATDGRLIPVSDLAELIAR